MDKHTARCRRATFKLKASYTIILQSCRIAYSLRFCKDYLCIFVRAELGFLLRVNQELVDRLPLEVVLPSSLLRWNRYLRQRACLCMYEYIHHAPQSQGLLTVKWECTVPSSTISPSVRLAGISKIPSPASLGYARR
jgi:hypothetical protein